MLAITLVLLSTPMGASHAALGQDMLLGLGLIACPIGTDLGDGKQAIHVLQFQ